MTPDYFAHGSFAIYDARTERREIGRAVIDGSDLVLEFRADACLGDAALASLGPYGLEILERHENSAPKLVRALEMGITRSGF